MSGHSHWATIKHKKAAQDAKKGKLFSKLARQLMMAAREGGDNPEFNPSLAKAIREAKQAGLPKDRIEDAIKKGAGKLEGQSLEQKTYEGKGPGGAMIIVEAITDNSNRTSMEVRKLLERNHGAMVSPGSAMSQFERRGFIYVEADGVAEDDLMEVGMEAGLDEIEKVDDAWEVRCSFESFNKLVETLEKKFKILRSETPFVPKYDNWVELNEETARKFMKLIEVLDDHDDVQAVHHNAKIPETATS